MIVLDTQAPVGTPSTVEGAFRVLRGKKALVTGGSRGIGRAACLALAEAGAEVGVNFRQCADAAEEVCAAARDFGVQATSFQGDGAFFLMIVSLRFA